MILEGPINNLSLGNVTLNIARELIKRNELKAFFLPPGVKEAHFQAYDQLKPEIRQELIDKGLSSKERISKEDKTVKIWHINGAERRITPHQALFTFYECDQPTDTEVNILNLQDKVILSSTEAISNLQKAGVDKDLLKFVPLGFDEDFSKQEFPRPNVVHFGLTGKFEKRKNTAAIISQWLDLYGNDTRYQLSCLINNPFFPKETYDLVIKNLFRGQNWNNVNLLPHLETNSQVNQFINSIDIDLSGINGNEGWNLPSFNAACLGKVCAVGKAGAHKDWADSSEFDNIVDVIPDGTVECYDQVFFQKGHQFNQGNFYHFSDETIKDAITTSLRVFSSKRKWEEQKELQEKFSYKNTVDELLKII